MRGDLLDAVLLIWTVIGVLFLLGALACLAAGDDNAAGTCAASSLGCVLLAAVIGAFRP